MNVADEKIESVLRLFDHSPRLVLFESSLAKSQAEIERKLASVSELAKETKPNPIEVVLESVINVVSEEISAEEITKDKERILLNSEVRGLAVDRIIKLVGNDVKTLTELHSLWLRKLAIFLKQIAETDGIHRIDEIVFLVSSKFRVSSLSAIKAIASAIR